MSTKQQIEVDLKSAMLAGDKDVVLVLRGLKSSILNAEIAHNKRESGLDEDQVIDILGKEAKKRQESADLYEQGGDKNRQQAELSEKAIIEKYLPTQLSDQALQELISSAVAEVGELTSQTMGIIIGKVKQAAEGQADGGRIANAVKGRMNG